MHSNWCWRDGLAFEIESRVEVSFGFELFELRDLSPPGPGCRGVEVVRYPGRCCGVEVSVAVSR